MPRCLAVFFTVLAVSIPAEAWAGPFGLIQGTPASRLQVVKKAEGEHRYIVRVPTPLSDFDFYIATVTPKEGLCRIAAIGETISNDSDGSGARTRYNLLRQALVAKYGNSKDYDFVHAGALYSDESEFAMAIHRGERSLASYWDAEEHSRLPEDISAIELSVEALSSSETYVNVTYELGNFPACAHSLVEARSDAL